MAQMTLTMLDLHTHLLPNIDDGARSLDEALTLCRLAVEDGTAVAVATPHSGAREGLPAHRRPTAEGVAERVAALQGELDAAGIGLRLVTGMEVYVEPDLPARELVTLGASRAILLEMPASSLPLGMTDLVFRLQVAGYLPVIAHPERNLALVEQPELLYELVSRGCLSQVTAASLTGQAGRTVQSASKLFLTHDLAHVIASDAHWYPERPTGLSAAVAEAAKAVGQERAEAMVTTIPQRILDGSAVTGFSPSRSAKRKSRWRFW